MVPGNTPNQHPISAEFDLFIIGSGPGGEGAAMQAAKNGLRVGMAEKHSQVGGACTHLGTIPSKALRHVAHRLTTFQSDPIFGRYIDGQSVSLGDLLNRAKVVTAQQVKMRLHHYTRNHIQLFHGHARFLDPQTIEITDEHNTKTNIRTKHVVIATGSRPHHPEGVDFSHPRIFDSDTILDLKSNFRTISVFGAGVIGCEYTCIFRSLDKKVNLINTQNKLMTFLDDDIIDALAYHLRDQGVVLRHNETLQEVEAKSNEVILHLNSGKKIRSDILLMAAGRMGNSGEMDLDKIGIKIAKRGQIQVNKHYQTAVPTIYAVGDVTGFPALASSAYDQGRFAASHILDPNCDEALVSGVPIGIYTRPEISCIGQTERELTAEKIPYEVGHAAFKSLARAQITGQTVGMLKILFDSRTLKVLGIHCFGQSAAEIIHIGQAVMAQKGEMNSLRYFINTTFNYPTMAEAYRVAALNGFNRSCE